MPLEDDPSNQRPKPPAEPYVCWRCGEQLPFALLPLTHLARCPHCRADLHACRLCRHHDRTRLNECRHERADPPNDRTQANYCTYFRPRLHAFEVDHDAAARQSEQALAALFGAPEGEQEAQGASPNEAHADAVDDARQALEALFAAPKATDQDKD
ncbi:MAG: hypothetical protein AAF184_00560 [Pseudomonadota bacterium]